MYSFEDVIVPAVKDFVECSLFYAPPYVFLQIDMIELLVQYGADINATTRSGQSILGLLFLISPALFGILLKNGRFIKCLALYSSASPSLFYQMRPPDSHA